MIAPRVAHVALVLGLFFGVSAIPSGLVSFADGVRADMAPDEKKKKKKKKKKDKKKGKDKGDKKKSSEEDSDKKVRDLGTLQVGEAGHPSYYMMPDILVNLASRGDRPYFLKLRLTLEAQKADAFDAVPRLMPRVTDQLQLFLRELHIDDLSGTAGGYRLRLELLRRLNLALAPQKVDAVLIEEMLIQ